MKSSLAKVQGKPNPKLPLWNTLSSGNATVKKLRDGRVVITFRSGM
jgi:hypothetical protein